MVRWPLAAAAAGGAVGADGAVRAVGAPPAPAPPAPATSWCVRLRHRASCAGAVTAASYGWRVAARVSDAACTARAAAIAAKAASQLAASRPHAAQGALLAFHLLDSRRGFPLAAADAQHPGVHLCGGRVAHLLHPVLCALHVMLRLRGLDCSRGRSRPWLLPPGPPVHPQPPPRPAAQRHHLPPTAQTR